MDPFEDINFEPNSWLEMQAEEDAREFMEQERRRKKLLNLRNEWEEYPMDDGIESA